MGKAKKDNPYYQTGRLWMLSVAISILISLSLLTYLTNILMSIPDTTKKDVIVTILTSSSIIFGFIYTIQSALTSRLQDLTEKNTSFINSLLEFRESLKADPASKMNELNINIKIKRSFYITLTTAWAPFSFEGKLIDALAKAIEYASILKLRIKERRRTFFWLYFELFLLAISIISSLVWISLGG